MTRQRTSTSCLPGLRADAEAPPWVAAWCAAQQAVEPENRLPDAYTRAATLRQCVRTAWGGRRWRLRLSNRYGDAPLVVAAAAVAPACAFGTSRIDPARSVELRFGGRREVHLPAGSEGCSDEFVIDAGGPADLAITLVVHQLPPTQTGHPGSRTTSFVQAGDHLHEASLTGAVEIEHWYLIADLEAVAEEPVSLWVAVGDSITDGRGSTTNGNDRWTDRLRERWAREGLLASTPRPVVVQAALGGNRLLHDRVGPSLSSRFSHDVLGRAGVRVALVHIGINDLGTRREHWDDGDEGRQAFVRAMVQGWQALADAAHARSVTVIGATLTPFVGHAGYRPGAIDEALRQELNAWIRGTPAYDAVADFDAALRDPAAPDRVREGLHCGDALHPSPAGLQALAEAVPLPAVVERQAGGREGAARNAAAIASRIGLA
ncbi:MAG: SGNH/GDSL hydrolase family protein [Rubrivivax sp.]|nr:SGNH/GDSL hydrolase family protein [Rubrivivax sp.]